MKVLQVILPLSIMVMTACRSTIPTTADMNRYYQEAEKRAQMQIARVDDRLNRGEISQADRDQKVEYIRASITTQASDMAWSRHALVDAQKVSMGVPTGDHPVQVAAPGKGGAGGFYRPAGSTGSGYQGAGAFSTPGSQPGSMIEAMRPSRVF